MKYWFPEKDLDDHKKVMMRAKEQTGVLELIPISKLENFAFLKFIIFDLLKRT